MLTPCLQRLSNRIRSESEQELDDFRNAIAEGAWTLLRAIEDKAPGKTEPDAMKRWHEELVDFIADQRHADLSYLEQCVHEADDLALGSYSDMRADERRQFNTAAE